MCGIVGGIAERNVAPILMEGLRRLEYRGYDSSGVALMDADANIHRVRSLGKIKQLEAKIDGENSTFSGQMGIAHTRWATHGIQKWSPIPYINIYTVMLLQLPAAPTFPFSKPWLKPFMILKGLMHLVLLLPTSRIR